MPKAEERSDEAAMPCCAVGAVAVGVGGNLIAGAKIVDFESITKLASEFATKIRKRATKGENCWRKRD
ncbi:MAG: hypothetical protein ACM3YE_05920 [Bacteroidota bacterium]